MAMEGNLSAEKISNHVVSPPPINRVDSVEGPDELHVSVFLCNVGQHKPHFPCIMDYEC